jgi:hypothetical protein
MKPARLARFQSRINRADDECAIIIGAQGKSIAQMRCAIAYSTMARQSRNRAIVERYLRTCSPRGRRLRPRTTIHFAEKSLAGVPSTL